MSEGLKAVEESKVPTGPAIARCPAEIQFVHDLFAGLILCDPSQVQLTVQDWRDVDAMASALCWILGHEHNPRLEILVAIVTRAVEAAGIELVDNGEPLPPGAERRQRYGY